MLKEVIKCAESNDIKGLHYIFVDSLDVDPTFETYREDYEYCKKIDGMFEPHRDISPMLSERYWTLEYWNQLKLDLMKNFSEKRFEHMISVARIVYKDKISRLVAERNQRKEKVSVVNTLKNNVVENKTITAVNQPEYISQKELKEKQGKIEEENKKIMEEEQARKKALESKRKALEDAEKNKKLKKKLKIAVIIMIVMVIVVLIMIAVQISNSKKTEESPPSQEEKSPLYQEEEEKNPLHQEEKLVLPTK